MIRTLRFSLMFGASLAALASPAMAQTVGTAGAVNPTTQGTQPGGATRQVTLGSQVIFKERFVTSPVGSLQLVFLDKSTLNIGPNSDVVINEYVYDPATRDGKMSVGLAKGALRFVGGQISHNGNAEIKTPVATIGLRGAVAATSYDPQQQTSTTSAIVGSTTVTSLAGGSVTMVQGYTTTVGQGQPPSPPSRTPPQLLTAATSQTTSQSGQSGGSSQPPSNQSANSQLSGDGSQSQTVLSNIVSSNTVAQQTSNTNQSVTDTRQTTQVTSTTVAATPIANNALQPRALAYTISGPGAGGSVPYLTAAFVRGTNIAFSPLLGYRIGGPDNLRTSETIRTLQVGFGIDGRGANQSSALFVAPSPIQQSDIGPALSGGFTATSRVGANTSSNIANSSVSLTPGTAQVPNDGSRIPTSFSFDQNTLSISSSGVTTSAPASVSQFGSTSVIPNNGNSPYTYSQTATAATPPANLGANRPAQTLFGYAAGIVQSLFFPPGASTSSTVTSIAVTGTNGNGQDVSLSFNPANSTASATINIAPRSGSSTFSSATLQLGAGNGAARSTYIDSNTYGLRSAATFDPATGNTTNAPGSFVSTAGSGEFTNGQLNLTSWNTIVSTIPGAAEALRAATDVTPCTCEFTQWGFWGGNVVRNNLGGTGTFQDRGNLLLFVAGQLSDPSLIPATGSATYNGHIIGNVQYGTGTGTNYLAGGSFSHTVNFGSGTGNLAFSFDQRNYSGTTALNSGNRANFNGSFTNTTGNAASGTLQGSFYGPNSGAGTAPLEQGGQFAIINGRRPDNNQLGYNAAGIFAARR